MSSKLFSSPAGACYMDYESSSNVAPTDEFTINPPAEWLYTAPYDLSMLGESTLGGAENMEGLFVGDKLWADTGCVEEDSSFLE
ncbi:hypothetical protein N0V94_003062 [Neodidymelliopsis sp. IMI 364377]|nr:hypothetical protein N0V94_003062 [Neodidymelliopsis sp. IMI 364377]